MIDENDVNWFSISSSQKLSENFIEKYKNKLAWSEIIINQELSEGFIERNIDKLLLSDIFLNQSVSEDFIKKYVNLYDKLDYSIIEKQKVPVELAEKYPDKLFAYIKYQKIDIEFIEKHESEIDFKTLSYQYEDIPEDILERHQDELFWYELSKCKRLSNEFIEKHKDSLSICSLSKYQKLSPEFIEANKELINFKYLKDNWIYKSAEEKKQEIIKIGKYECHDDYFIAYKSIRKNRYSLYNFKYKYEKGGVYESWCDCSKDENSFGLNVGTKEYAEEYGKEWTAKIIVRCKVRYEDVGRVVYYGDKVRCFKIEVLD